MLGLCPVAATMHLYSSTCASSGSLFMLRVQGSPPSDDELLESVLEQQCKSLS
jgi:hypothetical protein